MSTSQILNPNPLQILTDSSRTLRRGLRIAAGLHARDTRPVHIIEGSQAPRIVGESYYHTTLGGTRLRCSPATYGWPCLYVPSTRRVEVGAAWLVAQLATGDSHEQLAHRWTLRARARQHGRTALTYIGAAAPVDLVVEYARRAAHYARLALAA